MDFVYILLTCQSHLHVFVFTSSEMCTIPVPRAAPHCIFCLAKISLSILLLSLLSFAFTISNFFSAASGRPHPVLYVVLRCHRRSKSTGTHSQYAALFGVHRSRRVARRCNPTNACCCGMVPRLFGTLGHGAGPFPAAEW